MTLGFCGWCSSWVGLDGIFWFCQSRLVISFWSSFVSGIECSPEGFSNGAKNWGFGGIGVRRDVVKLAMRILVIIFPVDVPEKSLLNVC